MNALRTLAGAALVAALAVLLWASPASSITPPIPEGDANCDGLTNSIDAAVILQADAGLIDAVPCAGGVDLNFDGVINSLDAAIVLQITAGLCCPTLFAELTIDNLPIGVPYGEPIQMALSITNASNRQFERTYNSGQRYNFLVYDLRDIGLGVGTDIWSWSHNVTFIQIIMQETFDPNEKVTYRVVWNQQNHGSEQVEPGIYGIRASDVGCSKLPIRQCFLEAWLTFEILAPPQ